MYYFCLTCEEYFTGDESIIIDGKEEFICPFCDDENSIQIDESDYLYS